MLRPMRKTIPLLLAALMIGLVGLAAAPAAAQDYTVEYGQQDGGAFAFAQVNATDDGSTGAGGGAFVRPENGGVNTDADAGAAVTGDFTGAGAGAFASPFFVGAGAGGGSQTLGVGGGAGCGVPTLSPNNADCGAGVN